MSEKQDNRSSKTGRQLKTNFGYQPAEDTEKRGYQPQASTQPEGQNPPRGGSNVNPPSQSTGSEKE